NVSRCLLLTLTTASLIVACNLTLPESGEINSPGKEAIERSSVNIYSSRLYNTDDLIYENFTEQTGIEVNLIEGQADELIEIIQNEGVTSPADILITVDAGRLWRAAESGMFAPVESEVLEAKIPKNLQDPDNLWFGYSKIARVIIYNQAKVNPQQLSSYQALANPQWQGKLIIRAADNVYNQSLVAGMIEQQGEKLTEQWIESLVANFAPLPQGEDTSPIEEVAAGRADLTLANTDYFARYEDNPEVFEQVGVFFPNQDENGVHVNISGAGLLSNAPNKDNAIAFLEYLASPEAQELFAFGSNEYPAVEGIPANPVVIDFGEFKEEQTNVASYGRNNAAAVKIMNRAGWK
ncbi:MAG: extracellular solute-binding protein, partial [Cyanobacteria bacterium J06558_2]